MMPASRVSVVIPTFNRRQGLLRAIGSVRRQSFPAAEILVCDDGSTDGSRQAVAGLKDRKIRWIAGPHSGFPAVPRNRGIAAAKGTWVAFLDSDDQWLPGKLKAQMKALDSTGMRACSTNAWQWQSGARRRQIDYRGAKFGFESLVRHNLVICSSVVISRELLEAAGGFPVEPGLRIYEDYALWLRVAAYSDFAFLPDPWLNYHDDSKDSVRAAAPFNHWSQTRRVYRSFLSWKAGEGKPSAAHRRSARAALGCTYLRALAGGLRAARGLILGKRA